MPNCTVCTHPERDAIDHDLVAGKSFRSVALRFGVSPSAAYRHHRDHISADLARLSAVRALAQPEVQQQAAAAARLVDQAQTQQAEAGARPAPLLDQVEAQQAEAGARPAPLLDQLEAQQAEAGARAARLLDQAQAQQAAAGARALDLLGELQRAFERVGKLFDACDRWLTDPEHPERYDLGPRAEEVQVYYSIGAPGRTRKTAKAPLSVLLDRAMGGLPADAEVDRLEQRSADPRELVLKAARRLESELQLVARLLGQFPAGPTDGEGQGAAGPTTVNILIASPEWLTTRTAILRALEPFPDACAAVSHAIHASLDA